MIITNQLQYNCSVQGYGCYRTAEYENDLKKKDLKKTCNKLSYWILKYFRTFLTALSLMEIVFTLQIYSKAWEVKAARLFITY